MIYANFYRFFRTFVEKNDTLELQLQGVQMKYDQLIEENCVLMTAKVNLEKVRSYISKEQ